MAIHESTIRLEIGPEGMEKLEKLEERLAELEKQLSEQRTKGDDVDATDSQQRQ